MHRNYAACMLSQHHSARPDGGPSDLRTLGPPGGRLHFVTNSVLAYLCSDELRAPEGAPMEFPWITPEWALSWPAQDVWKTRRRA